MLANKALVSKRLPLLPNQAPKAPTSIYGLTRQVGDLFYRCACEVATVGYTAIDNRYPSKGIEHESKREQIRRILRENRNQVLYTALPLFAIHKRTADDSIDLADQHAKGYIVDNIFNHMVQTYAAWADQFVATDKVEAFCRTLAKVAEIESARLTDGLLAFRFQFRPVQHDGNAEIV
jgi:hypothetical protein